MFASSSGFSLIELLVVVALIGIITAIGIPSYVGYVDTSRANAAQNGLRAIYVGQQEYFVNNSSYYSTGASCADYTSEINTNLFAGSQVLDGTDYTYCITQTTSSDFTATASEVDGSRIYTIDNNNNDNF